LPEARAQAAPKSALARYGVMTPSQMPSLPSKARRQRLMLRWIRRESIGAPAFLSLAWGMTILAASLLLWGGITHDWTRGVLLLLAAAAIRGRLLFARLGARTPMDGKDTAAQVSRTQRWGELTQEAVILLAAGLNGYGSGLWIGPVAGVLAAGLLIAFGATLARRGAVIAAPKPDPALTLAVFVIAGAFEPIWGWRGPLIVIGLLAVCAVLAWRLWRLAKPDVPLASPPA
jgi:hypothetical protein